VNDLAPLLQGFFTDRLARQKKASPNTVAAYRDTCKLLLAFRTTWHRRRDHALLLLAVQTGLRVSELPASPARTPTWAPGRTSAATAKAAKTGQHH
jgi:hypothetical protein